MYLIGITGGTGCGKSMASEFLKNAGFEVIDADCVCREVVSAGKPALSEIAQHFGQEVLLPDGTLNRKALGKIVFSDSEKLALLNKIMFRYVMQSIEQSIAECRSEFLFLDAPLLIEYGLHTRCDRVICVLSDKSLRVERIMKRDGLSEEDAKNRINSQNKDEFYLEKSDYIVYNNSTKEELEKQIELIIEQLRALS